MFVCSVLRNAVSHDDARCRVALLNKRSRVLGATVKHVMLYT